MKVMILAAGRGQRMGDLTAQRPKPLLTVGGLPIIVHLIKQLRHAGLCNLVVNHAWMGTLLIERLGDGSQWDVNIEWSAEPTALETAGGIANALHLLGEQPFAVINGDIHTNFPFQELAQMAQSVARGDRVAECVLVPNPAHNPDGDFGCSAAGLLDPDSSPRHTYSGIGVYSAAMFRSIQPGEHAALAPLLNQFGRCGQIGARLFQGHWTDVGTPQRLRQLDQQLKCNGNQS